MELVKIKLDVDRHDEAGYHPAGTSIKVPFDEAERMVLHGQGNIETQARKITKKRMTKRKVK